LKLFDCPVCDLRADAEGHALAYRRGQHENDKRCVRFLKSLQIDAAIMSSASHAAKERMGNKRIDEERAAKKPREDKTPAAGR